jgi:hypothetical protein
MPLNINARDIFDSFEANEIGKVQSVKLIPKANFTGKYFEAHIYIDRWFETEAAFYFIEKLCKKNHVVFNYKSDKTWLLEKNTTTQIIEKHETFVNRRNQVRAK